MAQTHGIFLALPISTVGRILIVLLGAFGWQAAHALIVVDGRILPAWPDTGSGSFSRPALAKASATPYLGQYPHPKGTVYGLTLVIDFSDQSPAFTKAQVENWLNTKGFQSGNVKGSVRDFYSEISNGQVDFVNEVYGIYRAKQTKAYYEGGSGYARAQELIQEVLTAFDGEIDFSKFDNDKDGKTEAISLLYAGRGLTWGQGLWPHAGALNQKRDGVTLSRYMMTDMGDSYSLYVFCHEVGHMLFGWPDLYGVGDYCLMGNRMNDANPVPVNDFFRADQGWIPLVDISAADNLALKALPNGAGYRFLNPARSQECFFWSNIKNTGRYASLRGKGLLVWHFDKAIGSNDPPKTLCLGVVQADGRHDLDTTMWPSPGSDAKDFFGQGGKVEFSTLTLPAALWNDGKASGLRLHQIGVAQDSLPFAVGTGTPVSVNKGKQKTRISRQQGPDSRLPGKALGRKWPPREW